ncbi:MAG: hypothetical protein WA924_00045 [Burkholderiaceae bacterium]
MGAEYQHTKYGITALKATALSLRGVEPPDAWRSAAISVFPDSLENQNKGCPKATFLGLAEAGYIVGIQPGKYTNSVDNKRYAIEALRLLQTKPALASTPDELWRRASHGGSKKHNEQMHVVISLWNDRKFVCQQKARQA